MLMLISWTWGCTTFHNFISMFKKKNQKLAGLWLAGEVVNHVGIYGSKAAEGLSAFQRRSCIFYCCQINTSSNAIMTAPSPEKHVSSIGFKYRRYENTFYSTAGVYMCHRFHVFHLSFAKINKTAWDHNEIPLRSVHTGSQGCSRQPYLYWSSTTNTQMCMSEFHRYGCWILYKLNFSEEHKHAFTFYGISPH